MNFPEKLTGIYLRLNGFFLLPQFTIFTFEDHNHIDFLAFRPANSGEMIINNEGNEVALIIDGLFFDHIDQLINNDSKSISVGAVVEVKGNQTIAVPTQEKYEYCINLFGQDTQAIKLVFALRDEPIFLNDDALVISHYHVRDFILQRIEWMNEHIPRLKKIGSWNLSEESLSDVLSMIAIFYDQIPG